MATVASPIHHFKFNDNAGNTTVVDTMGGASAAGSQNTSSFTTTGKINGAFNFDGNDYVQFSGLDFGSGDAFSFSLWAKPNSFTNSEAHFIQVESEVRCPLFFRLAGTGNNKVQAQVSGASNTLIISNGTTSLEVGNWYHLTMTFDGTTLTQYINGEIEGNQPTGTKRGDFDTGGTFGCYHITGLSQYYVDAIMDDFRIYNFALTQDEVKAIYNNGNGTEEQNPTIGGNPKGCLLGFLGKGIIPSVRNC